MEAWCVFPSLQTERTRELCPISSNVSEFIFVFDCQIIEILFIILHQHAPWERPSAVLDHFSGTQQWQWTCRNVQLCPPSDAHGFSATLTQQYAWKILTCLEPAHCPRGSVFICVPCCWWSKGALPVFDYYSSQEKSDKEEKNRSKVRPGTFVLLLKIHLCWSFRQGWAFNCLYKTGNSATLDASAENSEGLV